MNLVSSVGMLKGKSGLLTLELQQQENWERQRPARPPATAESGSSSRLILTCCQSELSLCSVLILSTLSSSSQSIPVNTHPVIEFPSSNWETVHYLYSVEKDKHLKINDSLHVWLSPKHAVSSSSFKMYLFLCVCWVIILIPNPTYWPPLCRVTSEWLLGLSGLSDFQQQEIFFPLKKPLIKMIRVWICMV